MKNIVTKDLKLEIIYKPIDEIVGYVNNTRLHPQEQINQIKASVVEFGMCNPIGLHNGVILFGHGRWEALKQLDYKEVPTIDLSHLSEAQKKGLVIADNKIGDNSSFDEDMLKIEIEALQEMDFDIDVLGFNSDELDDLMTFRDDEVDDNLFEDEEQEDEDDKIKLSIVCENNTDKQQLKEELLSRGYICQ